MTREVSFRSFWNALSAPCDQDVFRQRCIGVLDFGKSELHLAVGELVDQVHQLAFYVQYQYADLQSSTPRTASALNFQNTFFPSGILLKGIDQGRRD